MCKQYLVVGFDQYERIQSCESDGEDQAMPNIYASAAAAYNSIAEFRESLKFAGMDCDLNWKAVVYQGPEQLETIANEAGLR